MSQSSDLAEILALKDLTPDVFPMPNAIQRMFCQAIEVLLTAADGGLERKDVSYVPLGIIIVTKTYGTHLGDKERKIVIRTI